MQKKESVKFLFDCNADYKDFINLAKAIAICAPFASIAYFLLNICGEQGPTLKETSIIAGSTTAIAEITAAALAIYAKLKLNKPEKQR